jgi:hypothetical protein
MEELKTQIACIKQEEITNSIEFSPDFTIQAQDLKTKLLNEENSGLFFVVMEKHKILKNFCSFMVENDKQLKKLINKMMETKKIKVKKGTRFDLINLEETKLTFYNTEQNMTTINQISDWNSNESN